MAPRLSGNSVVAALLGAGATIYLVVERGLLLFHAGLAGLAVAVLVLMGLRTVARLRRLWRRDSEG